MTAETDLISRQAAIDAWKADFKGYVDSLDLLRDDYNGIMEYIDETPSAQSEIIRCKDCKYQDEGYRRISVKWLPCMDIRPGSNWYCGSAERRE